MLMAGVLGAMAVSAHAELGRTAASIDADQRHIVPRMMTQHRLHAADLHEMTLDNGGNVREFTTDSGQVFAVSWQGPRRPDLRQLFGAAYFKRFQADNVQTGHIRMRRALASTHADFVVRTGGLSSAQWGYAILPQLVPAGFDIGALTEGDVQ